MPPAARRASLLLSIRQSQARCSVGDTIYCGRQVSSVLCRFARLNQGSSNGRLDADFEVHGMVMNIAKQSAATGGVSVTVEVHQSLAKPQSLHTGASGWCYPQCYSLQLAEHDNNCGRFVAGRVQVHIFDHDFASDFHGLDMTVQICGFLRYGLTRSIDNALTRCRGSHCGTLARLSFCSMRTEGAMLLLTLAACPALAMPSLPSGMACPLQ